MKNKRDWRPRMKNLMFYAVVCLAAIGAIVGFVYLTNPGLAYSYEEAANAVRKNGYTNVVVLDRDDWFIRGWWGGCGKDDDVKFDVTATNASGEFVELTACAQFGKGFVVRTDGD